MNCSVLEIAEELRECKRKFDEAKALVQQLVEEGILTEAERDEHLANENQMFEEDKRKIRGKKMNTMGDAMTPIASTPKEKSQERQDIAVTASKKRNRPESAPFNISDEWNETFEDEAAFLHVTRTSNWKCLKAGRVDDYKIARWGYASGGNLASWIYIRPDLVHAMQFEDLSLKTIRAEAKKGVHFFESEGTCLKYFVDHCLMKR